MSIAANILRPMAIRLTAANGTLLPHELAVWYPKCPQTFVGTNAYYGISTTNVRFFDCSGGTQAMNLRHVDLFKALVVNLLRSNVAEWTLNISLEPLEKVFPFVYVGQHWDLLAKLAAEIHGFQTTVRNDSSRKSLRVIIRYASEMNDTAADEHGKIYSTYAGEPAAFRETFRAVRTVFADAAPLVQFAFSPAIRKDLPEAAIAAYWPGDDVVDIVSGTWYVGDEDQFAGALANFTAHFRRWKNSGKPFGIDEFGGCRTLNRDTPNETGDQNDAFLQRMSGAIADLAAEGIGFQYASIFVNAKWGADAVLDWV